MRLTPSGRATGTTSGLSDGGEEARESLAARSVATEAGLREEHLAIMRALLGGLRVAAIGLRHRAVGVIVDEPLRRRLHRTRDRSPVSTTSR